jgi:putative acetyltransferase
VREEAAGDAAAVRRVNSQAFGRPAEADLVEALRRHGAVVLSLVAERAGEVLGHILFSPVAIRGTAGIRPTVSLGPLAVLPGARREGIGSALVRDGLEHLRRGGHGAVVVLGDPAYYSRFGFSPAGAIGLRSEYAASPEAFMAIELVPGTLAGAGGFVTYDPAFRMLRAHET